MYVWIGLAGFESTLVINSILDFCQQNFERKFFSFYNYY